MTCNCETCRLVLDVITPNVEVSYKLHKLWRPKFRNFAHQIVAQNDARSKVESALNRWYLEPLEE